MEYQAIEDYAAIGNMESLALVGKEGSIDFFCFPEFDSPSLFLSLLDPEKGGYFCIRPTNAGMKTQQLYLPNTNILLTRFLSDEGIAELTDFMPVSKDPSDEPKHNQIVRIVRVLHGTLTLQMDCFPRFDYARIGHALDFADDHRAAIFTAAKREPSDAEPDNAAQPPILLQSNFSLKADKDGVLSSFTLGVGEHAYFILGQAREQQAIVPVEPAAIEEHLAATAAFWRAWMAKSIYKGRWREMVDRSALLLKMLTSRQHGSLVAAPTFGLPESIGGDRNWDYRYTWLRDSSFSLYAFLRLGFTQEAEDFRGWLSARLNYGAEQGPLQVLYALDGRQDIVEEELPHLRGYKDSRPVRVGNAAYAQLQLDIYGELFDAAYLSSKYGNALSHQAWIGMKKTLTWLAKNWNRPDEGIWEVRGGRKNFLHSRLMCWVAFDRAIRLGAKRSLEGPYDWMEEARDAIAEDIYANFWNEELGAFVQYKGSTTLDAATLLMPLMRFISATDEQFLSTLKAIEKELVVDTLVYRYRSDSTLEGLTGNEGAFAACSFWYIECLARAHRVDEAHILFEKMLAHANHVGLYAEELSPGGQHLGNFPQAFTHLAFISAATYLDRALSGSAQGEWS